MEPAGFNLLLLTLAGFTSDSPPFAPGEPECDRGADAVEAKATKEANTTRKSIAENAFRSSMGNRRDEHGEQVI